MTNTGHTTETLAAPKHPLERLPDEWAARFREWGEPAYRGKQLFLWIHRDGLFDPAQMSNLPLRIREKLAEEGLKPPVVISAEHESADSTRKLLVRMADDRDVETVLIPQLRDADPDAEEDEFEVQPGRVAGERVTQCISSQVGCAMGCVFCASGVAGLKRSLSTAEIVSQVLVGRAALAPTEQLRNVVFMGMGEPLHNYDAVARALVLLTHSDGIALSKRRVTVSTSGLVPEIERLGREFGGQVRLAISLHSADNDRRSEIMPINRKYPLPVLMKALRAYPLPKRARITFEYTLIAGVNDSPAEADALAKLVRGIPAKMNLIPMNPISDSPLAAPDPKAILAFQTRLRDHGLSTTIRTQRGDDIAAACGQLALHGEKRKVKMRLPKLRDD